jgi:uncharacterized protein (TIGR02246 family)
LKLKEHSMHRLPSARTSLSAVVAVLAVFRGAPMWADDEDVQAIRDATASYVDSVNQGDLAAVAEHWTDDGDFIDEDGRIAKGRAMAAAEQVEDDRGAKLTVRIDSIRLATPDVAIAEGTARLSPLPPGKPPMSRFTAIWVKSNGHWLIDAVREPPIAAPDHHEYLTEIEWMIGDWATDDQGARVRMSCKWSPDGKFILRDIRTKTSDDRDLTITQRIGWDPLTQRIKSWIFDNRGSHGDSFWAQDDDRWIVESKGVMPGGVVVTGTHVYTPRDERTFTWESIDAKVGDTQLPDSTREFVRTTARKLP